MKTLKLDISKAGVEITPRMEERTREALSLLYSKQGAGNDFLGWVTLPSSIAPQELSRIEAEAKKLRECADVIICIGIGGSYLGAKAVAEAMGDSFAALRPRKEPVVVFAGQNLSEEYTYELLDAVKDHSIAAIVISKSGTTTEPAVAFRIVKAEIERRYGKAGAAISYALGQGAPMIAAVWGVFIWKEFKGADRKTNTLLAVMFLFFIAGLASIIASGGN